MKAVCWEGKGKVAVDRVPDPRILNPHDAVIKADQCIKVVLKP